MSSLFASGLLLTVSILALGSCTLKNGELHLNFPLILLLIPFSQSGLRMSAKYAALSKALTYPSQYRRDDNRMPSLSSRAPELPQSTEEEQRTRRIKLSNIMAVVTLLLPIIAFKTLANSTAPVETAPLSTRGCVFLDFLSLRLCNR